MAAALALLEPLTVAMVAAAQDPKTETAPRGFSAAYRRYMMAYVVAAYFVFWTTYFYTRSNKLAQKTE